MRRTATVIAAAILGILAVAGLPGAVVAEPASHDDEPSGISVTGTDTCHDSDADDLREATVIYDLDSDVYLFSAAMCDTIRTRDWEGERFLLWEITTEDGVYNKWVYFYEDAWHSVVEREDDEETTFAFEAVKEGEFLVSLAPPDAFDGADEFEVRAHIVDDNYIVDALPESHEWPMTFPMDCSTELYRQSVVTTRQEDYERVGEALGDKIIRRVPQLHAYEVAGPADAMMGLSSVAAVHVEPLAMFTRQAVGPSDDPLVDGQWSLARVGAARGWAKTSGSGGTIAVLDDGVDGTRPDLAGRVTAGYDAAWQREIPANADSDRGSHGTAVAGVAAADGRNNVGLAGIDWTARIAPYRVFDATGCSSSAGVADAIVRAVDDGADVINMSVGTGEDSRIVRSAVAYALDHDVPIIAAVGNSGEDENRPGFPAAYDDVIAVGATTRTDGLASYSVTGDAVDVVAPGGDGSETEDGDVLVLWERGTVAPVAGTSFAAPMVAGAVSLYRGLYPAATVDDIREALTSTSKDLGASGRDDKFGHGLLDLPAFLAAAPMSAAKTATVNEVSGADPKAMSIAVSRQTYPAGADMVIVASAITYADALASARLQAELGAPLLLTDPSDLPIAVRDEIRRLNATDAVILGGRGAVSEHVESELARLGLAVSRLSAPDRIGTAVKLAQDVPGDTAVLVRAFGDAADPSRGWADALAAGALAANKGWPVLLSASDALSPATADFLLNSNHTEVVVVGGLSALSDRVVTELAAMGLGTVRVSGPGRAETAAAVAAMTQLPQGTNSVVVVDGWHPDAWAAGFTLSGYAARHHAAVVLASGDTLPPATADYVTAVGDPTHLLAAGLNSAVLPALQAAAER